MISFAWLRNLSSGVLPLTLLNLGCTRHSSSQLGSALICTRFQAEYRVEDYPGTPPPSVYQVTHGTALQAAECYVQQRVLWRTALQAAECYVRQRGS